MRHTLMVFSILHTPFSRSYALCFLLLLLCLIGRHYAPRNAALRGHPHTANAYRVQYNLDGVRVLLGGSAVHLRVLSAAV